MTIRYLKSRKDGTIFEWDPILADNPSLYEVTEEQAFPERFIPVEAIAAVAGKRTRQTKAKLDLHTETIPEPPEEVNVALGEEASRGLPS
jgi:hypothetical protein